MNTNVKRVLGLREGHEAVIDGWVWFRIDAEEYKVHREGTTPDTAESGTVFVARDAAEIEDVLSSRAT